MSKDLELSEHTPIGQDYLQCMHEVDAALGSFRVNLEETQLSKSSIIVISPDHASGLDYPMASYIFEKSNPPEHIPLFMITPDHRIANFDLTGSHIDTAPTILDFWEIDPGEFWRGKSLLNATENKVIFNFPTPLSIEYVDAQLTTRHGEPDLRKFIEWSEIRQSR